MSRILSGTFLCAMLFSSGNAIAAYNPAAGKAVYDVSCATCHKTGMMGAPKTGDKASWAPRLAQKIDVLVSHSDKGFRGKKGMMPAKGGNAKLTTAEVGNAVAYMVSLSK
ncbi:MAG: cytochrome c5 family protein [Chlorobiaceae bacterium]|nr:cytochrome c5 family protein [Chlorobiaceae bacterium]